MTADEVSFQQQRLDAHGRHLVISAAHAQLSLQLARVEGEMRRLGLLLDQAGTLTAGMVRDTAEIQDRLKRLKASSTAG